jgi:glucose-1-phosphate thymidylyltransferase
MRASFSVASVMQACRNLLLLPDDSESEEQKPGAIKAMANAVAIADEDDVLVIAGDGMFRDDLSGMMETFRRKRGAVVALYQARSLEEAKRCAVACADNTGKITAFVEKPAEPKTMLACGAVYVFPKGVRRLLAEYMAQELPADQPGRFVEWLYRKQPVYSYTLKDHLWDIGTCEAYRECDQHFSRGG